MSLHKCACHREIELDNFHELPSSCIAFAW